MQRTTQVLFRPDSDALRFLPEGPYACGPQQFSWVGIQHGPEAQTGSLNVYNLETGENMQFDLRGRPGFAFPTTKPGVFVVGLERELVLFKTTDGTYRTLASGLEAGVENTIVNDGLVFDEGLVFGAKDLEFASPKAGLYFWRHRDRQLIKLRGDQICSNGKFLTGSGSRRTLYDIDSPTKTIVASDFDLEQGRVGEPRIVIDLRDGSVFPDGMVVTPDGRSLVVALYNPEPADAGEARQYNLESGELECVWKTPGSPQVTCPLLIEHQGRVRLILTTAVEHMSMERQSESQNAGCLFVGETDFETAPAAPRFSIPD